LGTPSSGTLTNATGLPLTTGVTGLLPVANGGTGTATPALVAGTNVTITGSWPNQTINSTASGGGSGTVTSVAATVPAFLSVAGSPITTTGTLAITLSGTALPVLNGGTGVTTSTGSGNNVLSTSPTFVTPILGTPTSATLTNATGLPISTGVSGLGTGIATALAVNVGTAGAPVVNGGALGTPSGGTATNLTGLPLSTGVTGTLPIANGGTGTTSTTFVNAATNVTGTLPIANGGTGQITLAAASIVTYAGTETLTNKTLTSPTLTTPVLGTPSSGTLSSCTVDGTNEVGFKNIPQNSQSAAYTLVLADAGKHIFHPSGDANARTYTIPANSSVAYPIGTAITFINMTSQVVTIAITTDTMYLSSAGTTGSRSLAQYGSATAIKMTSTTWLISGSGLT
jgi:hypothetical protein